MFVLGEDFNFFVLFSVAFVLVVLRVFGLGVGTIFKCGIIAAAGDSTSEKEYSFFAYHLIV